MTKSHRVLCALRLLGAMTLTLGSMSAQTAPMYRITRIMAPVGQDYCRVLGLNDAGQAIGDCNSNGFFVWTQATGAQTFSDPKFPGARFQPAAINNVGVVTGHRYESHETRNPGFIWDAVNGFRYFGGQVGTALSVSGINDSNQVVGIQAVADGSNIWKSFRWSEADGKTLLKPFANRSSGASAINNAGQIAGTIENLDSGHTHAVRYEPNGDVTYIMSQHRPGSPFALNNLGHVAGMRAFRQNGYQAFVWTPETGAVNIDGRPRGSDSSYAQSINDAGQVVGVMSWVGKGGNTFEAAFYWDAATGMRDLMTLLDPSDPLTAQVSGLGAPSAQINAHGQIVVDSQSRLGESWPLLLTPVAP